MLQNLQRPKYKIIVGTLFSSLLKHTDFGGFIAETSRVNSA